MQLKAIDDRGHCLALEAANDFLAMKAAAKSAGYDIDISTAYRTHEEQKALYTRYIHDVAAWERRGRLGPRPTPVAIPGKSNHERGTAVDIHVAQHPALLIWLRKHAGKFHFHATVSAEPWHWDWKS